MEMDISSLAGKAAQIAKEVQKFEKDLLEMNENYALPWRLRTAVRDLEALMNKADYQAMEVLERIGTDQSEDFIEEIWGPFGDDD